MTPSSSRCTPTYFRADPLEDRMELEGDRGRAEGASDFLLRWALRSLRYFSIRSIVGLGDLFDQVVPPFFVAFFFFGGDGLFDDGLALVLVVADVVIDRHAADAGRSCP